MRILLIIVFVLPFFVSAQKEKPQNYRRFDEKWIHFGFMLGGNTSNYALYQKIGNYENYGLKYMEAKSSAGGQVGIVTTLKLGHPVVRLRFIPTLSFQERVLNYTFVNPDTTATADFMNQERINSTNLDFPLMLQFRTLRLNNFAAYCLGGIQYTLDLQSQQNSSQDYIDPFVKVKKSDWQGQIGAGIEIFAPYFKFGVELKYSHSFNNVFIQDGTMVSDPIDRLYNKTWWLSFIFEG